MVVRVYCDRCNKDITNESIDSSDRHVDIDLNGFEHHFVFCEECFNWVCNYISKIVPEEIWDGSPDYPTEKEGY